MRSISPRLASELADVAYSTLDAGPLGVMQVKQSPWLKKAFELSLDEGPIHASTGGMWGLFRKTSGFAMVGHGKNLYQDHHVITIRGTRSGHDWLTNGNFGLATCESGMSVHAGFHETFSSMRPALESVLTPHLSRGSALGVHCVGHSLGGALAALTADWIKKHYRKPVNVYTFGAPRVGMSGFAANSTFGSNALYRCTHGADPVPNVPLWPFLHAPHSGFEYRLDNGSGISLDAHGMSEDAVPGYRNTADSAEWSNLRLSSAEHLSRPVRLAYERRHDASFSGYWADRLSAALITLLKDAGYYTAVLTQASISGSLTFYDLIARTLSKIAEASVTYAEQTRGLLGHMLVFAGYIATRVADLTYSFIRWVFDRTTGALYRAVRQAIDRNEQ